MKLAIIGTAGRKEDADLLSQAHWRMMCVIGRTVAVTKGATELISGGAAFSDHVAVQLFLDDDVKLLSLHLPAELRPSGFTSTSDPYDAGRVANHYHREFSKKVGIDSITQLNQAVGAGAKVSVNLGGFKARNTDVANSADVLLAFTFGKGERLKESGTKDTWDKFLARRAANKLEADMNGAINSKGPGHAYHFDLNSRKLYLV